MDCNHCGEAIVAPTPYFVSTGPAKAYYHVSCYDNAKRLIKELRAENSEIEILRRRVCELKNEWESMRRWKDAVDIDKNIAIRKLSHTKSKNVVLKKLLGAVLSQYLYLRKNEVRKILEQPDYYLSRWEIVVREGWITQLKDRP